MFYNMPFQSASSLIYECTVATKDADWWVSHASIDFVICGWRLWGAVCKKNYLEQICDIFSYLEIIKTARKFIYK